MIVYKTEINSRLSGSARKKTSAIERRSNPHSTEAQLNFLVVVVERGGHSQNSSRLRA